MNGDGPSLAELLVREHRRLDNLLGRFLSAAEGASAAAAREAMLGFDELLRRHTAIEEEHLFPLRAGEKLVPREEEGERVRLFRVFRLEHVQIRELSGMLLRLLAEKGDVTSARGLLPNLLRRWDAHSAREEREVFPRLEELLGSEGLARARRAASAAEGLTRSLF